MRPLIVPVPAALRRPATAFVVARQTSGAPFQSRDYATTKRRSVTPFNDDGRVAWSDLSAAEKTSRAAQQTFNLGFIVVGVGLTVRSQRCLLCVTFVLMWLQKLINIKGAVVYFLWTEVFSTESKVTHFNRAVDRIKKDDRCVDLLGDAKKIVAHGEETHNRWARSRPIASTEKTDQYGNQHLIMNFHVCRFLALILFLCLLSIGL